jgi:hypothetical protein
MAHVTDDKDGTGTEHTADALVCVVINDNEDRTGSCALKNSAKVTGGRITSGISFDSLFSPRIKTEEK